MHQILRSLIALGGIAIVLSACESAPITGRSQLMLVSESQEREMGLKAYRQVLAEEPASHDAEFNALVEKVGRRIAAAAESPPEGIWQAPHYHWEFRAIQKNEPNAFCLPGGKIAVYSGLLPITRNEAGLATVIGHEVAHALARHSAERLSDQTLVTAGVAATAIALGTSSNQRTRSYSPLVIAALGAGASVGILLPMSRTQEAEADHIGLILMALAGYDPHEAIGLWERMRAANKGGRQAEWLSTHPADETRIDNIRRWVPEAMQYYRKP